MKNFISLFAILFAINFSSNAFSQNWTLDNTHSKIEFSVLHLLISDATGNFKSFDGKFNVKNDDFTDTDVEFTIDVNSINTDNENRDGHLKSDDFFNAEKYPTIKFKSKSFKKIGDKNFKLIGDLTIRDSTKTVEWDATYGGTTVAWGQPHAGFKLKSVINRFDFGLKWDKTVEAGGLMVGKDVTITVSVELVKKEKK
ncbi:MAG: YceI family protein [Bacteroidota bacterium]